MLEEPFDARRWVPAPSRRGIWLPLRWDPETADDANNLMAVAQLASGLSTEAARQQAQAAAERFRAEFPTGLQADASFDVTPIA